MSKLAVLVSTPLNASLEPLQTKLREIDYDLSLVSDLDAVFDYLKTGREVVVLVNIGVPEIPGIEICRAIRDQHKDIKIIALNQSERTLHNAALAAGADVVLDEPIIWSELYLWLQAPRTADGNLLSSGAIFGDTPEDVLGSVALLAHDLKSPITVVISSLQTLLSLFEEDDLPELSTKLLKGALYSAYRQMYLVGDMIDLARLELDNYELQMVQFDLVPFIRECVEGEQYGINTKGLVVHLELPDTPIWIEADSDLIRRVVNALIDNTLKFTVRGDHLWIRAEMHVADEQVELQFRDTGRAIRPGFEESIMNRAPQWAARQTGTRTSVAVGLPFVKQVVKAHGGTFTAGTNPDDNITTFTVRLVSTLHAADAHASFANRDR